MIKACKGFYYIDPKEHRDSMIQYEEGISDYSINIEIYLIKVLNLYLKEIDTSNDELNASILRAFLDSFE